MKLQEEAAAAAAADAVVLQFMKLDTEGTPVPASTLEYVGCIGGASIDGHLAQSLAASGGGFQKTLPELPDREECRVEGATWVCVEGR
jgi:hypothetical protein